MIHYCASIGPIQNVGFTSTPNVIVFLKKIEIEIVMAALDDAWVYSCIKHLATLLTSQH